MRITRTTRIVAVWLGATLLLAATVGADDADAGRRKSKRSQNTSSDNTGSAQFHSFRKNRSTGGNGNATQNNQFTTNNQFSTKNGLGSRVRTLRKNTDAKKSAKVGSPLMSLGQNSGSGASNAAGSFSIGSLKSNRFKNRIKDRSNSKTDKTRNITPFSGSANVVNNPRIAQALRKSRSDNSNGKAHAGNEQQSIGKKLNSRRIENFGNLGNLSGNLRRKNDSDKRDRNVHIGNPLKSRTADIVRKLDNDKKFQFGKKGLADFRKQDGRFAKHDGRLVKHDGRLVKHDGRLVKKDFVRNVSDEHLNRLANTNIGRKLNLKKQFELYKDGDLARRLNLAVQHDAHHDGHHDGHDGHYDRHVGRVSLLFANDHFGCWYAGPSYLANYCWAPHWCDWVDWCWWDRCPRIWDPRPVYCRPIYCDPCPRWGYYACPVWLPLPVVSCGTWIDIPRVTVQSGLDLQLLAVRFVDGGHPERDLGPRFRVWLRNNSPVDIKAGFNVLLLASNERLLSAGLPESGVRVPSLAAGEITSVDIRLPLLVNQMGRTATGQSVPFEYLHVLVDSHREIPEAFEENNGAVLARGDVLPVDPAVFGADVESTAPGSVINLAGEGLGPEPGEVIVSVNGLELQAEIQGWYDLGARIALPNLPVASPVVAEIIVVRGDGAAARPLELEIVPAALSALPLPPQ